MELKDSMFVYNFLSNGKMFDLNSISNKDSHEFKLKCYFNECCYIYYHKLGKIWKFRKRNNWKSDTMIFQMNQIYEHKLKTAFLKNMNLNMNKYRFKNQYFEKLSY